MYFIHIITSCTYYLDLLRRDLTVYLHNNNIIFVLTKMLSHHGIAFYDRNKICLELLTMTICRLFFLLFVKGIRPNTILHGGILYQHRSCRTYSCLYLTVLFPYFFARLFLLRVEGIQLWLDFSPWDTSQSKKVLVSVRLGFFFTANCPTAKNYRAEYNTTLILNFSTIFIMRKGNAIKTLS